MNCRPPLRLKSQQSISWELGAVCLQHILHPGLIWAQAPALFTSLFSPAFTAPHDHAYTGEKCTLSPGPRCPRHGLPARRRPHPLACSLTFAAAANSRDTCACQHSGASSHFLFLPAHFSRSVSDQGNLIPHVPTFYLKTEQWLSKINSVHRQGLEAKCPLEMNRNFLA